MTETPGAPTWMQPNQPLRIYQKAKDSVICSYVLAVAVHNFAHVEFLTIDGNWLQRSNVMYGETLINGEWLSIDSRTK